MVSSTFAPLKCSSQQTTSIKENHIQRQIASRPSANTAQTPDAGRTSFAAEPLALTTVPSREPPTTKQPNVNTSGRAIFNPIPSHKQSVPPSVDKSTMAAAISPSPTADAPKISMTSKEWVIPPRPKPGRKPATDTPPTKRKAQNRAAQRAFRERRAARVGELELLLDEQKETQQQHEKNLMDKIRSLELDLQSFRSRCMLLESMLDRERQERIRAETQVETLKNRRLDETLRSDSRSGSRLSYNQIDNPSDKQNRNSLEPRRHGYPEQDKNFTIPQIITPPESLDISAYSADTDAVITCGNCSPNGRCACAEEVLASASAGCGKCDFGSPCQCLDEITGNATHHGSDLKRPASSTGITPDVKRQKSIGETNVCNETDFTTMTSHKSGTNTAPQSSFDHPPSDNQETPGGSMIFKDSCGFCKDGTYCVCADDATRTVTSTGMPTETVPLVSHQTQTPPPSEPDILPSPLAMEMTADGAVKLPRRKQSKKSAKFLSSSSKGGCGINGPGTCAQCQADPKSGLFCRLMNAKFSREQGSGCCGGKGAAGGCCKSKVSGPEPEKITLPSLPSLGLSCAEAYQTLSSHRNFSKAADDISSWLPKLKTTTNAPVRGLAPGRQAIEVEAASIMSVLKEFDVRFGRDA